MNLHSIDPDALLLLYQESVTGQGGKPAVHDAPKLDAALAYPLTRATAGAVDVATIAAAYAAGMLSFRPFSEGNTGAALLALELFLSLNGWELEASREEVMATMQQMEARTLSEAALANWIRQHL